MTDWLSCQSLNGRKNLAAVHQVVSMAVDGRYFGAFSEKNNPNKINDL
ncbi:hypothetical protein [Moraxella cuniculi]|nr:hypothetical protein [Moraxella cuniculi]